MARRTNRVVWGLVVVLAVAVLALPTLFLTYGRNKDIPVGYGAVRLMVLTGPARHAVYGRLPDSGIRTIEASKNSRWWCVTLGDRDYHFQWFSPRLKQARSLP